MSRGFILNLLDDGGGMPKEINDTLFHAMIHAHTRLSIFHMRIRIYFAIFCSSGTT